MVTPSFPILPSPNLRQGGLTRDDAITALSETSVEWDVLVLGGGATGLGCALEAATRGYRTLLVERGDFAQGTSSRSTKLVHGGVRYLKQGNIGLVRRALYERGLLLEHAPHLAHPLRFIIPAYDWWAVPFYRMGLAAYDRLAGARSLGRSRMLGPQQVARELPNVERHGLLGGVLYYDAQFDDARLAITLLRSLTDHGGLAANYAEVVGLSLSGSQIHGARIRDTESGREYPVNARVVINATGVFVDEVRAMDGVPAPKILTVAQGSHLVLPREFLPGQAALMVPKTSDGRVLFAIPWHDRVVIGTTDFQVPSPVAEPRIQRHEVDYLLSEAARYLERDPAPEDVLATFTGLRPLVRASPKRASSAISRDHTVLIAPSGLVTITGGKWTTYRHMGEDAINHAARVAGLPLRPSRTASLALHGASADPAILDAPEHLAAYGSERPALEAMADEVPEGRALIHPRLPYWRAEVIWAVRHEMARTVEDVLARRTRSLLLDSEAAAEAALSVSQILASELGRTQAWAHEQCSQFQALSMSYRLPSA